MVPTAQFMLECATHYQRNNDTIVRPACIRRDSLSPEERAAWAAELRRLQADARAKEARVRLIPCQSQYELDEED